MLTGSFGHYDHGMVTLAHTIIEGAEKTIVTFEGKGDLRHERKIHLLANYRRTGGDEARALAIEAAVAAAMKETNLPAHIPVGDHEVEETIIVEIIGNGTTGQIECIKPQVWCEVRKAWHLFLRFEGFRGNEIQVCYIFFLEFY